MRAVLDVNVLVSALLSANGAPARVVLAWLNGAFELVVSPMLLEELRRAFSYPKIRSRVTDADADRFIAILLEGAIRHPDPGETPPIRSSDAGDDYLLALAAASDALLVSGDGHLLELADRAPIHTPAEFADMLSSD